MAKYNSDCKNEYAMQLMGECFRNSLKYYKKNVFDYDYFNPVLLMRSDMIQCMHPKKFERSTVALCRIR